ncbi:MAG: hypothetical protein J6R44_05175 [Clostridia bacterium]|nr:hypothetical protein [Clostridia bacterium]MBO7177580.1 hypothetical protein [Clostridia bacterium]
MKKAYRILVLVLAIVFAFSLCGCIFNKGTAEELEGVYALEEYYYKHYSGEEYEFEENYEYFILVIKRDTKVDVIYKLVGGQEQKSTHSYTMFYNQEDASVVDRIEIRDFPQSEYSVVDGELVVKTHVSDISFNFYPKREDLVSNEISFQLKQGTERVKYQFTRVKDKVNDKNIDKAKIKSREIIQED